MDEHDRSHLRRCVELASDALDAGDEPFGSVLVSAAGDVLAEERNRVASVDATRHPEFELARWAAEHLPQAERPGATVYTSGEHCPMCSAAHAWAGLGRIVYVASARRHAQWLQEWGVGAGPVRALPVNDIAPGVPVEGPDPDLEPEIRELHRRFHGGR
ncbi:MAG: nucleoside deaminase [Pseudonocardia sediminis]